jgi:excisionase family DNA binding protein
MQAGTPNNQHGDSGLLGGDRLLRIKEVAEFLRSSDKTVRRLIDEGKLRSVKLRGLRLVRASDLSALIQGATT